MTLSAYAGDPCKLGKLFGIKIFGSEGPILGEASGVVAVDPDLYLGLVYIVLIGRTDRLLENALKLKHRAPLYAVLIMVKY